MGLPDPARDPQFYQGVPLRRLVAFVIDTAVIVLLMASIAVVAGLIGLASFGLGWVLIVPGFALAGFLYRFTMLRERSATLGMLAAGIELRGPDGARVDAGLAAVHTLGFYATLYLPVLMVLGIAMMGFNPRRQLLHDLPLGTAMINRPE